MVINFGNGTGIVIMGSLVIFGLGQSARAFVKRFGADYSSIIATVRDSASASPMQGVEIMDFNDTGFDPRLTQAVGGADVILCSVPPDAEGDPVLEWFGDTIQAATQLKWLGYLSTIGVYGDHQGGWVDETTPVQGDSERSHRRVMAEQLWQALAQDAGLPLHIFRLAGIYGPAQNALVQLRRGTAKRVIKPGQVFNRIHVDDIAQVLAASIRQPRPMAVYNVTDDHPCPPQDVVTYAAELLGVTPPAEVAFEQANFTEMARSFYSQNKCVYNRLIREELGVTLLYPTYREGLQALMAVQAA